MAEAAPQTRPQQPGLAAANERLLVRLGFDLHDGPLQQVHALAQDVRLLREQVLMLTASEYRDPLVGRFADVESQLAELHQDLRDLAHSLEPRSLLQQPLPTAIGRELKALARRTGIVTSVAREGSFAELSASQRIALLRVLQEALSNVRQHSGASSVEVEVVENDEGGIGVVGMHERLRLLGGRLDVESGPDGTAVRAFLPRWSATPES
jgi:signal transduction histidine kinase